MKIILRTALVGLLLTGVSGAALAQDRDHGDRGGARRDGGSADQMQSPQGGHARFGAPPPSSPPPSSPPPSSPTPSSPPPPAAARQPAVPAVPSTPGGVGRFDGAPGDGGRHWDRGGQDGQIPPGRAFDHARPNPVVPSAVGPQRGFDGHDDHHDGHDTHHDGRDGHHDGHDDGHDNHWADREHRDHEHWERGRYPPVFWSHDRYRVGVYRPPYGFYVRAWGFGDFLPRPWFGRDYYLDDFLDFGLPYPPPGYEWVRVGGDAIMIDAYTGRVVQVIRGIFW